MSVNLYAINGDKAVGQVFLWALLSDAFKIEFFENFMNATRSTPSQQADIEAALLAYDFEMASVPKIMTVVYPMPPNPPPPPGAPPTPPPGLPPAPPPASGVVG